VHITLAQGQCDRWDTIKGAESHGFVLLHRAPFQTLPLHIHPSYFVARRHQSGKGFAARIAGSKTLTFGRKISPSHVPTVASLPWYSTASSSSSKDQTRESSKRKQKTLTNSHAIGNFKCDFCSKTFKEERSKRNHTKNSHNDADPKNGGSDTKRAKFSCEICIQSNNNGATSQSSQKNPDNDTPPTSSLMLRRFNSLEALKDHITAKHSLHATDQSFKANSAWAIKPDDANTTNTNDSIESTSHGAILSTSDDSPNNLGQCEICGISYHAGFGSAEHEAQFRPTTQIELPSFSCSKCAKLFREPRALRQHKNFCLASEEGLSG
jgi:hypothetical protein